MSSGGRRCGNSSGIEHHGKTPLPVVRTRNDEAAGGAVLSG